MIKIYGGEQTMAKCGTKKKKGKK